MKSFINQLILLLFFSACQAIANCPEVEEVNYPESHEKFLKEWVPPAFERLKIYAERYDPTSQPLDIEPAKTFTKAVVRTGRVLCYYKTSAGNTVILSRGCKGTIQNKSESQWNGSGNEADFCWSCRPINFLPSDCPFVIEAENYIHQEKELPSVDKTIDNNEDKKSSTTHSASSTSTATSKNRPGCFGFYKKQHSK